MSLMRRAADDVLRWSLKSPDIQYILASPTSSLPPFFLLSIPDLVFPFPIPINRGRRRHDSFSSTAPTIGRSGERDERHAITMKAGREGQGRGRPIYTSAASLACLSASRP